ncbi:MAG TPA: TPM domain-containing protein [Bacteroidota bacterium]|nr:TPM domain-containing protein [Bacteroidota bacterium]
MATTLLTEEELRRIASTIAEVEETTSGEIRVNIHAKRSWRERKLPLHELALRHFHALGMQKTRDKTGVLIFICVLEREFRITADEGIHAKLPEEYWSAIAETMAQQFKAGHYCEGICFAVREIGTALAREFPLREGDTNELSNDVSFS